MVFPRLLPRMYLRTIKPFPLALPLCPVLKGLSLTEPCLCPLAGRSWGDCVWPHSESSEAQLCCCLGRSRRYFWEAGDLCPQFYQNSSRWEQFALNVLPDSSVKPKGICIIPEHFGLRLQKLSHLKGQDPVIWLSQPLPSPVASTHTPPSSPSAQRVGAQRRPRADLSDTVASILSTQKLSTTSLRFWACSHVKGQRKSPRTRIPIPSTWQVRNFSGFPLYFVAEFNRKGYAWAFHALPLSHCMRYHVEPCHSEQFVLAV